MFSLMFTEKYVSKFSEVGINYIVIIKQPLCWLSLFLEELKKFVKIDPEVIKT